MKFGPNCMPGFLVLASVCTACLKSHQEILVLKNIEGFANCLNKQDNVHTNTESVQCISIVYSLCLYKYNQLAV